jgi:hypothetical protein
MAIKIITELKEELSVLPNQYKQALETQTQTILKVEKLKREISKLKETLSSENETDETELIDETDDNIEVINLETNLEKLKLKLAQTEDGVELNVRKTSEKVTESYVKALVGTDEKVCQLKEQLIDAKATLKVKQSELQRERRERYEKQKLTRPKMNAKPESEELDDLEIQLILAEGQQFTANDEVEVIKFNLETFRLLVGLETLEEV